MKKKSFETWAINKRMLINEFCSLRIFPLLWEEKIRKFHHLWWNILVRAMQRGKIKWSMAMKKKPALNWPYSRSRLIPFATNHSTLAKVKSQNEIMHSELVWFDFSPSFLRTCDCHIGRHGSRKSFRVSVYNSWTFGQWDSFWLWIITYDVKSSVGLWFESKLDWMGWSFSLAFEAI